MAHLDDLSRLSEPQPSPYKPERDTLLQKYRIHITHFEFDYVETCNNSQELEKILEVLLSGEEGYYPDLIKTTKARLATINPKSKILRTSCPVLEKKDLKHEELEELSNDLNSWMTNVSKHNKELKHKKSNNVRCDTEVRKSTVRPEQNKPPESSSQEKRIPSYDYQAWDKYDPDTELLKMELQEDSVKKFVKQEIAGAKSVKKSVTFNKYATETEANFISDREREKGNDFFKAGEYKEALECYSNSISCKATTKNLTNRAAVYIKLKKYQHALEDCEKALAIDSRFLKAQLRKAQALEQLHKYEEALGAVELVIEKEPNNVIAQELAERVRKYCRNILKNTRMKIVEIE